jgi:CDP-paratose 2-epimerase
MKTNGRFRSALVIGGAGFIGSNWAHRLLQQDNVKVHVFDNLSRPGVRHNLEWLQREAGDSGRLLITVGDIRDSRMVERAVAPATEVYHFAAQVAVTTSLIEPRYDFDVNLAGTLNVLEAVRKSANRPFLLYTSTNKVYGEMAGNLIVTRTRYRYADIQGVSEAQPLDLHSPYGCSKGAADQYVRDYARMFDLPNVVLRMSCIAGPRQFGNEDQGWVAHFLYSALRAVPVTIYGDGRQVRDILCIEDLLDAFDAVLAHRDRTAGEIYNVGGGPDNASSLVELIADIESLTGRRLEHVFEPRRPGDQLVYISDVAKLQRDTGWRPRTSVRQTLEGIYAWWKKNRQLFPEPVAARAPAGSPTPLLDLPRSA